MRKLVLLCMLFYFPFLYAEQKSVSEFTESMEEKTGLFTLYYQNDKGKIYLKIDRFNEQFLFQSSLPQGVGSNDIGLDRGQLGDTRLVQFERYGDKVLLKQLNTAFRASSPNTAEQASIDEAFADSVIVGLPVVASDETTVVVDYTAFLFSDIHQIGERLKNRGQGSYSADAKRSGVYMPRTKSFPNNTELEALVTFAGTKPGQYVEQVTPAPESISVHLHHSLIKLPDDQYNTRQFHPYSGFWSVGYQDYSVPIEQNMTQRFIPRHRLNKRNPAADVSEAIEPIVYYLDPGIPEPIKSALYDGAMWWDQAFSHIGYRDAFQVKVLPEDADPMDVRYNVIQWVHRATRGWSYGSSVIDPRTGEIIKGHVTLGSLRVRQDYLIALGLTSPFSVENADTQAQKDMALARIRQLSAHEVGHTLGIAHNFAASENNRASVMDYPHPYVKLEGGKISLDEAYDTGIGAWDKQVIEYGYQDLSLLNDESARLLEIVNKSRELGLLYQSDPDSRAMHSANQRGHLWDNGKDPVAELNRVYQIREFALRKFGLNSIPEGTSLSSIQEALVPIYLFHRYQLEAASKLLGGTEYEYETKGDYAEAKGIVPVSAERQSQALDAIMTSTSAEFLALQKPLLRLITPKAYGERNTRESFKGRMGVVFDSHSAAESAAAFSLRLMLRPERLNRIAMQKLVNKDHLGVNGVVDRIISQNIKPLKSKNIHELQPRLAYLTLNAVMQSLESELLSPDAKGGVLFEVINLHKWLKNNSRNTHSVVMAKQLDWFMQTGEWKGSFKPMALPPGSPI